MELRGWINKNGRPLMAASAVVLIVAALFSAAQLRSGGRPPLPVIADRAFFTSDDGATQFVDSIDRIPPFDHEGRPAVKAYMFSCDTGKHLWVQYLEKMTDAGAKQMAQFRSSPPGAAASPGNDCWLVKKPGDDSWTPRANPASQAITQPQYPGCDPASIREASPR